MQHVFPETLRTIGSFAIVLGVLVFFHELGHYLAARWRGVYVEAFSIGFGPSIVSWYDRHGTQWRISWLPLGGYVKMHGQERPEDVSDEVRASWKPGQTFHEKPVLSRFIIVAAGPLANFVLAIVVFSGRDAPLSLVGPDFGQVAEGLGALAFVGVGIALYGWLLRLGGGRPGKT